MRLSRALIATIAALTACGCARQPQYVYSAAGYAPVQAYDPYAGAGGYAYPAQPMYGAAAYQGAAPAYQAPDMAAYGDPPYQLDSGDRVRVTVYGQEGLNNTYVVDPSGLITLPLAGPIQARGFTKDQLAAAITAQLKQGYIREPHVAVEIETYRPFFILGEVNAPGQYPYVANLTIENAVAIAGGFSPRADKRRITVTRTINGQSFRGPMTPTTPIRPGDTVQIEERWF